jgi:hypothetical protein
MNLLRRFSPVTLFLCICAVYLAGFFSHAIYLHKTVYGDGVYYYSWLRSVIIDHNIDFRNEYASLGGSQPYIGGVVGNKYSVGPAIAWMPAFLFVRAVNRGDGYGFIYQLAVGFTSVGAALVGLLLLWRLLERFFSATISILTVVTVAGATNLLFYGSLDAVNSHALSFCAACIFLSLLFQKKKQWFAIGAVLGFLGIIRTQDLLYGILIFPYVRKINVLKILCGVLVMFIPQLLAWQALYGKFWTSPYLTTGIEGFNFLTPHIIGVLFNVRDGLFLWTPVALLAAIGLVAKKRWLFLSVFLSELYVVASWSTWWQGASYSGRMFVSSLPLLAFGVAAVFHWLTKHKLTREYCLMAVSIPLTVINTTLITSFLLLLH